MRASIYFKYIFRKYPGYLIKMIMLVFFTGLLEVAAIVTVAPIVDIFINPDLEETSVVTRKVVEAVNVIGLNASLITLMVIFIIANLFSSGIKIWIGYMIVKTRFIITKDIVCETIETFYRARWSFFTSNAQGRLHNVFMREVDNVASGVRVFGEIFRDIIFVITYFCLAFYMSLKVTSIIFIVSILLSIPFFMLSKITSSLSKKNLTFSNLRSVVLLESFSLSKIILGFGKQIDSMQRIISAFRSQFRISIKFETMNIALASLYFPTTILILMISILFSQKLKIPLPESVIVLLSIYKALPLVAKIAANKVNLERVIPSFEMIADLKHQADEQEIVTGETVFKGINEGIAIEDVSFGYEGHKQVLENLNINIPKGKMVAIVGESGAGKSTLIDLIMRLNEPSSGQIKIDGVPLQDLDINSYRSRIGYVPQECVLFNMTIAENLRWANASATDERIKRACKLANADVFIEELPKGYDTVVGDRGVCLSGGQSQRVALARAIIRDPELLVLDEATSALDTLSEQLIQQAIERITKDTTAIIIAHRLSTIINSDYIYVLKKGQIIEEGTYSQLIMPNGYFKKMVDAQKLDEERLILEKKLQMS
jgi:ABC-type multidrug transport system fused ATPase/permease subunit